MGRFPFSCMLCIQVLLRWPTRNHVHVIRMLKEKGYCVIMRVLDCRVLGNPQSRERVALVAARAGLVNGQGWQW